MFSYIIGIISETRKNYITLDHAGIGYRIYVSNPYEYKLDASYKVFLYHHVREDLSILFGFMEEAQKDLFINLIAVKGIGPKTAIGILAVAPVEGLKSAIEHANISYLRKVPGIGPKAAQQIVLDLKGKLGEVEAIKVNEALEDAIEVLLALDYKVAEINKIKDRLSLEALDANGYVKKALTLLVK